jgi:hypothetical protein
MQPHNLTDENSCYVRCLIRRTHRNKVSTLRQSVYHHKNRVVSPCRQGQSNNKIHRNDFPFRFWNVMWLKSYKPFMTPTTLLSHLLHCVHSPYINTITTQASSSQLQASMQASNYPMQFRTHYPPPRCKTLLLQCRVFSKQVTSSMWPSCRTSPSCLKISNALGRILGKYPTKVKQSLSKPSPMCKFITHHLPANPSWTISHIQIHQGPSKG